MKQNIIKKILKLLMVNTFLLLLACNLNTSKDDDKNNNLVLAGLALASQNQAVVTQPTPAPVPAPEPTTCSETTVGCRIFLTDAAHNGNLGGIAGADQKCNADSAKPSSNFSYKALIVDGSNRTITINDANTANPTVTGIKDWVLKPNTKYFQKSGAEFATTTSVGIFLNGTAAMSVSGVLEGFQWAINFAHTGLTAPGTTITGAGENGTCSNWTFATSDATIQGRVGGLIVNPATTPPGVTGLVGNYTYTCEQSMRLVCVEQ